MKKIKLVPPSQRQAAKSAVPRRRGAPLGNTNALKHGRYTREMRALGADIRAHIYLGRALVRKTRGIRDRAARAHSEAPHRV